MNRRQALKVASAVGLQTMMQPLMAQRSNEATSGYPSRPVTLVVGFSSGGPTDSITRLLANLLSRHFKQSFVVENRLGANGTVAAQHIKAAKPDGYTLFLGGSGTLVVAPNLNGAVMYDTMRDFIPVARVSDYPYFLVVPVNSPITTTQSLIERARGAPGKLSYASAGIGAGNHLAGEWFKAATGIDVVHVPYKGDTAAMMDVLAGRVDFSFLSGVSIEPHVKAGKLRVLGVSSLQKGRAGADVPLIAQAAGISDFAVEPWTGIFSPAGMSDELVLTLSTAINEVMARPESIARLTDIGQFPLPGTAQEFRQYIEAENARWANVISIAKIPKVTS